MLFIDKYLRDYVLEIIAHAMKKHTSSTSISDLAT